EPLGNGSDGMPVYLKELWPTSEELKKAIADYVSPEIYHEVYQSIYENDMWNEIKAKESKLYQFEEVSTYIRRPPFFTDFSMKQKEIKSLSGIRAIAKFGDSITTDHISPAGNIGKNTPAAKYLTEQGVTPQQFNTYGSRRGNHEVMMRGTFANVRINNRLAAGTEGGYTTYWPTKEVMSIYDACMRYKETNTGLLVLAGKDYGMGSSRDWAAKGPSLLGVQVVLAESYERIHRSNLVMMGVLPLQYTAGETAESLGLTGEETFEIIFKDSLKPRDQVRVIATGTDGSTIQFHATVRFDSYVDIDYYRHGGILPMVLRQKLES
ncbi:MAG: acnA, partial [Firmicutes bacterium]|nr:acnA [Bacillota bacterium]